LRAISINPRPLEVVEGWDLQLPPRIQPDEFNWAASPPLKPLMIASKLPGEAVLTFAARAGQLWLHLQAQV
jgi:hypothetical protein